MREKRITQEDLCPVFQVKTRSAIGHYFNGRREPSIEQLVGLSQRLGVSISVLLGESPLPDGLLRDPAVLDILRRLKALPPEKQKSASDAFRMILAGIDIDPQDGAMFE